MASVARFYGWTHETIMDMDTDVFYKYLECVNILEAQEQLKTFTTNDWPKYEKSARTNLHRKVHKRAYPALGADTQVQSSEQMASVIKGVFGG